MTALNTQFCTEMLDYLSMDSYPMDSVLDYQTNKILDGSPSVSLIKASLDAEPTGAVLAYLAEGTWHYVREQDESLIRGQGHDVRTVYVA
jgi:hypothetical protein